MEPYRQMPPIVHSLKSLTLSPIQSIELQNGTTLKILTQHDFPNICRITIVLPGGLSSSKIHNVANLSVNDLREGTQSLTGEEIADKLECAGAWLKTGATETVRIVTLYTLCSQFSETTNILHDIINTPVYPTENLEKSKTWLLTRLGIEYGKVSTQALIRTHELLFPDSNPMHFIDSFDDIRSITRDQLIDFRAKHIDSRRTRIYVAGNFDNNMIDRIISLFGTSTEGNQSFVNPTLEMNNFESPKYATVEVPDTTQDAINISIPSIGVTDPDYPALKISVKALGGYFGARLMKRIREEKGYTYGITSSVLNHCDASTIRIQTECDPSYTVPITDEIRSEIEQLISNPPTGDELRRIQQNLLSGMASTIDSPFSQIAYHILNDINGADLEHFSLMIKEINQITSDKIAEITSKYINLDKSLTVVAGKTILN